MGKINTGLAFLGIVLFLNMMDRASTSLAHSKKALLDVQKQREDFPADKPKPASANIQSRSITSSTRTDKDGNLVTRTTTRDGNGDKVVTVNVQPQDPSDVQNRKDELAARLANSRASRFMPQNGLTNRRYS